MPRYIDRHITPSLLQALSDMPVVCLLGPRQSGKSTLAKACQAHRHYLTLDDPNQLQWAKTDPKGFIEALPDQVTIDEIQRVPELTLAIKLAVDQDRRPGRFLLTGSAHLLHLPRLADSLAGRMACLYLHPLSEAEKEACDHNFIKEWLKGNPTPHLLIQEQMKDRPLIDRVIEGGYPEAYLKANDRARAWQRQYLHLITERDIQDASDISRSETSTQLLNYLAQQTATLLNVSSLANSLGLARATVEGHLRVLERLFLIRRLPAWHNNRSRRLIKTPKIHIRDSGLGAALAGFKAPLVASQRPLWGRLLESFVVQQVVALSEQITEPVSLMHYRDKDKIEVDLVVEHGLDVRGIEVKGAKTAEPKDALGLRRLAHRTGDQFKGGLLFYDGTLTIPLDPTLGIYAVPISKLWQSPVTQTRTTSDPSPTYGRA